MNALRFHACGLLLLAGILADARAGDLAPSELDPPLSVPRSAGMAAASQPAAQGRA
jgi:hypothetical protein